MSLVHWLFGNPSRYFFILNIFNLKLSTILGFNNTIIFLLYFFNSSLYCSAIEILVHVFPTPVPWNNNILLYGVLGDKKLFKNFWFCVKLKTTSSLVISPKLYLYNGLHNLCDFNSFLSGFNLDSLLILLI